MLTLLGLLCSVVAPWAWAFGKAGPRVIWGCVSGPSVPNCSLLIVCCCCYPDGCCFMVMANNMWAKTCHAGNMAFCRQVTESGLWVSWVC